eukprot:827601-Pleurochrysis_carterae.AAC.1
MLSRNRPRCLADGGAAGFSTPRPLSHARHLNLSEPNLSSHSLPLARATQARSDPNLSAMGKPVFVDGSEAVAEAEAE